MTTAALEVDLHLTHAFDDGIAILAARFIRLMHNKPGYMEDL